MGRDLAAFQQGYDTWTPVFVAFVVKLLFACVTVLRERPRCLACPLHYGFARARRNLSSRVNDAPRNYYGLIRLSIWLFRKT